MVVEEQQQRERREREAAVRRKEKHQDGSANASSEVKQKLQVSESVVNCNFKPYTNSIFISSFCKVISNEKTSSCFKWNDSVVALQKLVGSTLNWKYSHEFEICQINFFPGV
jgi:hypothetical protein